MRKAFTYTRALGKNRVEIEADVDVRPSQSIVMKYQMGDGPQVRRPDDVGLAEDVIYVAHWKNSSFTRGIHRNSFGNLPGRVAASFEREALGRLAKFRAPSWWVVYTGDLDFGRSRVMGNIARLSRGYALIGMNGRDPLSSTSGARVYCSWPSSRPPTSRSGRSPTTRPCAGPSSGSPS